jgi:hypothetical protein
MSIQELTSMIYSSDTTIAIGKYYVIVDSNLVDPFQHGINRYRRGDLWVREPSTSGGFVSRLADKLPRHVIVKIFDDNPPPMIELGGKPENVDRIVAFFLTAKHAAQTYYTLRHRDWSMQ